MIIFCLLSIINWGFWYSWLLLLGIIKITTMIRGRCFMTSSCSEGWWVSKNLKNYDVIKHWQKWLILCIEINFDRLFWLINDNIIHYSVTTQAIKNTKTKILIHFKLLIDRNYVKEQNFDHYMTNSNQTSHYKHQPNKIITIKHIKKYHFCISAPAFLNFR